jgi:hypothetical protein
VRGHLLAGLGLRDRLLLQRFKLCSCSRRTENWLQCNFARRPTVCGCVTRRPSAQRARHILRLRLAQISQLLIAFQSCRLDSLSWAELLFNLATEYAAACSGLLV